jgi:Recombination endonuclease VII
MESIKARAKHLLDNFKLTIEKWGIVEAYQRGVCAACGKKNKLGKRLSTDHDHKTGLFRGLLCAQCNRLLGKIEDPRWQATPSILRALADYWDSPPATKALGYEHYGYSGKVGTKTHRKLLKKLAKAEAKQKRV